MLYGHWLQLLCSSRCPCFVGVLCWTSCCSGTLTPLLLAALLLAILLLLSAVSALLSLQPCSALPLSAAGLSEAFVCMFLLGCSLLVMLLGLLTVLLVDPCSCTAPAPVVVLCAAAYARCYSQLLLCLLLTVLLLCSVLWSLTTVCSAALRLLCSLCCALRLCLLLHCSVSARAACSVCCCALPAAPASAASAGCPLLLLSCPVLSTVLSAPRIVTRDSFGAHRGLPFPRLIGDRFRDRYARRQNTDFTTLRPGFNSAQEQNLFCEQNDQTRMIKCEVKASVERLIDVCLDVFVR